jgi:NAD(P)-dependent dehydrogenase (short-subunit alcohol dehydrogenase family)
MTINFGGRVAIVTGAGGGLGRCHALELARRGAKVVVNDLGGAMDGTGGSSEAARKVVEEIRAAGGEAIANGGSVSDPAGARSMVQGAMEAWGRVDILINNAGILRDKSFSKMSVEDFRAVLDVHLMGAMFCTREVWPIMREQNYGRIVMTTSPSGLYGNFGQTNYGAAKLALVGFMNTLKIEGAKNNVYTNAIAPVAATRMTESLMPAEALKRLGPELVTPAVLYLCSEQAPNGVVMQAAGGRYSIACIVENAGVDLGADASVDDIAANYARIADLTGAKPRNMLQLAQQ